MSWLQTTPIILTCIALLFVPGGAVALGLGLRGLPLAASAPVITVAMSATTAIVCGKLGLKWGFLPVVLVAAIATAVFWGVRFLLSRRVLIQNSPWSFRPTIRGAIQVAGLGFGAIIVLWQLVHAFAEPENISQTFDNIFHLNAVRYILDTGNGSSLFVSSMTTGGNPPYFYPAAWHGLVALLVQITGTPISVAANIFNIVVAALVWTLGAMLLTRVIVGNRALIVGFSGVLAACFSAFPLLLLDFGVLYPNFLSVAMIPLGLAAVAVFFGAAEDLHWHPLARFAVAPIAAVGIAIAHPNGAMTLVALSIPVVFFVYVRRYFATGKWRQKPLETAGSTALLLIGVGVVILLWKYVRPPAEAAFWDRVQLPAGAIGEILTNSPMQRPTAWAVSVLMVLGIYAAIRTRKYIWLLAGFGVVSFLFIMVSAVPKGLWRDVFVGVWYNDSYRLAAILPIMALPLAAIGFGWIVNGISRVVERRTPESTEPSSNGSLGQLTDFGTGQQPVAVSAIAIVIAVLLTFFMQGSPMKVAVASAGHNYAENPGSSLLSSDELDLIDDLDSLVGPHDVIAASPWTGAAMAYALADRKTTSTHTLSTYSHNVQIINNELRDADSNPEVCPAVKATGVKFVLDFGAKEVHDGRHPFPGLENLSESPAVKLVKEIGEAKLYRVTACQ